MRKVRTNAILPLLAICLLTACSSPSIPPEVPITVPEPSAPVQDRDPDVPEGFMGDRADGIFHRIGCPRFKADPSQQMFFVTPFDALNDKFAPCKYCDPMRGWQ